MFKYYSIEGLTGVKDSRGNYEDNYVEIGRARGILKINKQGYFLADVGFLSEDQYIFIGNIINKDILKEGNRIEGHIIKGEPLIENNIVYCILNNGGE